MAARSLLIAVLTAAVLAVPGVASAADSVTITSPASGSTLTGTRVTMTSQENTGCDTHMLNVDGVGEFLSSGSATAAPGGGYQASYTFDSTGIANGSHQFTVTSSDCYGSPSPTSVASTFVVRNNAPAVSITSPASGATVAGTIKVDASATPDPGGQQTITKVEFYVDDTTNRGNGPFSTDNLAPYEVSLNTSGLPDGTHNLYARAYDSAGLIGTSAPLPVAISNHPNGPFYISSPTAGSNLTGTQATVSLQTSGTDCGAPATWEVDGVASSSFTPPVGSAVGDYTFDSTTYPNGTHTLVARCYDSSGRPNATPAEQFVIRNNAPTVSITSPASGSTVMGNAATVSATATADIGTSSTITRVDFYLDALPTQGGTAFASDNLAPYQVALQTAGLRSGQHNIYAVAYDSAGLVGYSAPEPVNVQNYALRISPSYLRISRTGSGALSTRLVDGSQAVPGQLVSVYVRGPGTTLFHLSRQLRTDASGLARTTYLRPTADFRWYIVFGSGPRRITSPTGLVQVR